MFDDDVHEDSHRLKVFEESRLKHPNDPTHYLSIEKFSQIFIFAYSLHSSRVNWPEKCGNSRGVNFAILLIS